MQLEASANKKEKAVDVTVEGWYVEASDDDWLPFSPDKDADPDQLFIPKNVALLFSKVAEKKVLSLSCHCPRRGPSLKDNELSVNSQSALKDIDTSSKDSQQQAMEVDPVPLEAPASEGRKSAAFDFGGDDEDDEKPSAKRKSLASSKKKKEKVTSSMTNVMNDLLRHKLLDDLEANKNDEEEAPVTNKDDEEDKG